MIKHSRSYVFENEEKRYLSTLPELPYEYAIWKKPLYLLTTIFNFKEIIIPYLINI